LRLFDTHAHLNSPDFTDQMDAVIDRAKASGLEGILVIGVDLQTSRLACDLAAKYPGYLYAAIGIQPNSAGEAGEHDFEQVAELAAYPGVRAIGETGIDCYWDDTPIEVQKQFFDDHIGLCRNTGLPMVIHMRESGNEIVEQLGLQSVIPPGVMHSFTGDEALAKQCLELGLYISFAGMVTFKKNDALREVAKMIPEDRLLIETDSPYLSPEPLRGRRPNEPERVRHILDCLAETRGVSSDYLAEVTTQNAKRLLQLP
jgi:TatD DNase family protein